MLFNSYTFILLYLPITLIVFFSFGKYSPRHASVWLTVASLAFYGWWSTKYVILLCLSITFNYAVGAKLARLYEMGKDKLISRLLILGIIVNLILLGYYKYANFFIANINALGANLLPLDIILPIGISFFTFTQIAFLVDAADGKVKEYDCVHYALFVTYFPHLIAGPVLHHKEMMPQFSNPKIYFINYNNIAIGVTIFFFGLFKKLILADNAAGYATPVFEAAENGVNVSTFEAWGGVLAYTMQIYFDFSGYTDMAIGSSRMFGVVLPINFNSPYKATNIIDFWRRWHMSLSRFLRDYLYIPLGGNRKGMLRRYMNIMITMVIGGLWHGANWTFIIWGFLHGFYLLINHSWQSFVSAVGINKINTYYIYRVFSQLITFMAVILAWVFFRSNSLSSAVTIIKGMIGINGTYIPLKWVEDAGSNFFIDWLLSLNVQPSFNESLFDGSPELRLILFLIVIVLFLPNTVQIFSYSTDYSEEVRIWKPNKPWLFITILIGFISLLSISDLSEFIYFQF